MLRPGNPITNWKPSRSSTARSSISTPRCNPSSQAGRAEEPQLERRLPQPGYNGGGAADDMAAVAGMAAAAMAAVPSAAAGMEGMAEDTAVLPTDALTAAMAAAG